MIKVREVADITSPEPKTKEQKIRDNLKRREKRFAEADDQEAVERWKNISKHQTGGKW